MFNISAFVNAVVVREATLRPSMKEPKWRQEHIDFLRENHSRMTDEQIAAHIGRGINAVKVFRVRRGLKSANRSRKELLTMNQCAEILSVDVHAMSGWCDAGLFKTIPTGEQGLVRLIKRSDLTAWAVNPWNWPYFDWREITDPHIRRLCELRSQRWGDEWWTTKQVAEYHGIDAKDVVRHITHLKRLEAYQPTVSKGGRHPNRRWAYWYVRKSIAMAYQFKCHGDDMAKFTPRADAWLLKAHEELGMSFVQIGRTMGKCGQTIGNRYARLKPK
jgi:hypothetical protein